MDLIKYLSKKWLILLLSFYPVAEVLASYTPVNGRISYLVGVQLNTNFQEQFFNSNDTHAELGRCQSIALLLQVLGDIDSKSSLMAESTLGMHKFCKQTGIYLDEFKLEAISFDLGYRRLIIGNLWVSAGIGSLYSWNVKQEISSGSDRYNESEFRSLYSGIFGIQYEGSLFNRPVSYDLRVRKHFSNPIDDQMSLGFSIGFRFGT